MFQISKSKFIRQKKYLIQKIKYYSEKLLFPISFIDIFKSNEIPFDDIKSSNYTKIYNYLNEYNELLIKARLQMKNLEEIKKWGIIFGSYTFHKVYTDYIISMIILHTNLILMMIEKNVNNNKNKIYDSKYLKKNSMHQNILLFMKIHKMENKYVLINNFNISPVSPLFIDSLFTTNNPIMRKAFYSIQHPLYQCDQLKYTNSGGH